MSPEISCAPANLLCQILSAIFQLILIYLLLAEPYKPVSLLTSKAGTSSTIISMSYYAVAT
jgi:hypothetical protein